MTEQKAESTPKNQVTKEAHQDHRLRLVFAVLTVFPESSAGHMVVNGVWQCALSLSVKSHAVLAE